MSFIITLVGLIISILLFAQLFNESRLQIKQIRRIFGKLVIQVEYEPLVETDENPVIDYPVISTSITSGRQGAKKRYYIDLPIPTKDDTLKESAVEFVIEPQDKTLGLFIRALDQEIIWVYNNDHTEADLYMKEVPREVDKDGNVVTDDKGNEKFDWEKMPDSPIVLENKYGKNGTIIVHERKEKIRLSLGDEIVVGNTLYSIRCEGRTNI